MFALALYDYVYPYGFIFGPLMIAALVISTALFVKYRSSRKYVLPCTAGLAVFECLLFYSVWWEGVFIGFITLTFVGIMAVFHCTTASRFRISAGLSFIVLGYFELILPLYAMSKVEISFQYLTNLARWMILLSLALTALAGGFLILIATFKKHLAT